MTPAFELSVTWSRPPDSVQATQVSTVPKASSPRSALARSGSAASSRAATRIRKASRRARVASGSAPTGSPVARSQTTVEARWSAMPTTATGPASFSERVATSSTAAAMALASNSTRPGNGVSGSTGTWWTCSTSPSGRTTALRTPEVPTSTTRMLTGHPRRATGRARRASRAPASRG